MNKINYLLSTILSLFILQSCGNDDADNPTFGNKDVPRIYIEWRKEMYFSTGDTIKLFPEVSPADNASFVWKLGDEIISTEKHVKYIIPGDVLGEFVLKYEVERNGIINSRVSNLIISN